MSVRFVKSPSQTLRAAVAASRNTKHRVRFEFLWRICGGPALTPEFMPVPGRKFRSDYAHEPSRTLIELDGAVWVSRKGHSSGGGLTRDREKDFLATLAGWRTVRLTPEMITHHRVGQLIHLLGAAHRITP